MVFFYIFQLIFNFFLILYFNKITEYINLFDRPDKIRKFHKKKIANIGGFILFSNFFFYIVYISFVPSDFKSTNIIFTSEEIYYLFIFSFLFFILGFVDDKYELSANLKLNLFFFIITFLLFFDKSILIANLKFSFLLKPIDISKISFFFTLISFLLFINAFNMFDGINLQSALYSSFLLLILLINGFAIEIIFVLILPLLFFIYLNHNNKCFLGDNGSLLISYLLSYLFIKSYNTNNIFYADQIFLLMMIPGFDLLRLAITRIYNGKHPFKADRNHLHHNLLQKYGYIKTLLIMFSIIIIPNIISLILGGTLYLIFITSILYFLCIFATKNKFY
jgi:UDP-GlcNAc:undecaprenyl-phosphate GlcNAc-1-phosphate transferase